MAGGALPVPGREAGEAGAVGATVAVAEAEAAPATAVAVIVTAGASGVSPSGCSSSRGWKGQRRPGCSASA